MPAKTWSSTTALKRLRRRFIGTRPRRRRSITLHRRWLSLFAQPSAIIRGRFGRLATIAGTAGTFAVRSTTAAKISTIAVAPIVGRLIRFFAKAYPFGLSIYVARLPRVLLSDAIHVNPF